MSDTPETSEEAFLRQQQGNNYTPQTLEGDNEDVEQINTENGSNGNTIVVGNEAQQIESSDEYDPAQDVTDVVSGQQAQVSSLDSAETNSASHPTSSSIAIAGDNNTLAIPAPSNNSELTTSQSAMPSAVPSQVGTPLPATSNRAVPSAMPTQRTRLPNDLIGILEDRIAEDIKGDVDAWLSLIDEYKKRGKLEDTRKTYKRFLEVFPLAAEQWSAFVQFENEVGSKEGVQDIFSKELPKLASLRLWTDYMDFIRRYYNVNIDKSGNASQTNHSAYQAVLDVVGIDKDSGKLWQDFIEFIKSGPGTLGKTDWQSQSKMDVLRKAYQDAISIPTQAVESLWKDYSAFENGLNKLTGRQFLQKKSADYMSARASYTELQNITRELDRTTLPKLPPALGFAGDMEYMKQVEIWNRWIQWEKEDPLVLKDDNSAAYKKRVLFVYKQALMALTFWPEMWYDAAEFCFANNLEDEGKQFLEQGAKLNPESSLLAFKEADRLEMTTTNGSDDDSKAARGDKVSEPYNKLLDALYALIEKAMAREKRDIAKIEAEFADSPQQESNGVSNSDSDEEDDEDDESAKAKKASENKKQLQINAAKAVSSIQITLLHKSISHAWIALMRSMQRMQGKGKPKSKVGGSRQVFVTARSRGRITSEVYIASALLEYHNGESEPAKKIFERGSKLFPEDEHFALEYIKLLTNTNDHTNARAVFAKVVDKLTSKQETVLRAKPLFAFFHKYESQFGELAQIQKLETRMKELYPDDPKLYSFSQRFVLGSFDPTAIRPIISPRTQARPKAFLPPPPTVLPTVERLQSEQPTPPTMAVAPVLPVVSSPKRALEDTFDSDQSRPRKVARGDSPNPLAGAAGRRLNQMRTGVQTTPVVVSVGNPPAPPPLPRDISFLLGIIPPASTYNAVAFNVNAMIDLIRNTNIPTSADQLPINQRPTGGGGGYYR